MDSHKSSKKSTGGQARGSPERGRSESPKGRKSRRRSRSRERAESIDSRDAAADHPRQSHTHSSRHAHKHDARQDSPPRSGKRRSRSPVRRRSPSRSRSRSPRRESSKSRRKDRERERDHSRRSRTRSRSPRRSRRSASHSRSRSRSRTRSLSPRSRARADRRDRDERTRTRHSRSPSPRRTSQRHRSPDAKKRSRNHSRSPRPHARSTVANAVSPPATTNLLAVLSAPPTAKHWSPKRPGADGVKADAPRSNGAREGSVQCISPAVAVNAASDAGAAPAATVPPPSTPPVAAPEALAATATAVSAAAPGPSADHGSPALGHAPTATATSTHEHKNSTEQSPTPPAAPLLSRHETPIPPSPLAASITARALPNGTATQPAARAGPMPGEDGGWPAETADDYELLEQIGEGTFGQVYRGRHRRTGEVVALKKIRTDNEREGFPITALREVRLLRQLQHSSIVRLLNVVSDTAALDPKLKANFYLVFEYMDHDLSGLLESGLVQLTHDQIRALFRNLVEGLAYCHSREILHRDIKGSNLLVDRFGHLKLADFGLARRFAPDETRAYTNRVITLWYRPPELLLGSVLYGGAVDMWSAGCILGELYESKPILRADTEIEQLDAVFRLCGSPSPDSWPSVSALPLYATCKLRRDYPRQVAERFSSLPADALDLLDRLLSLDPERRPSAASALQHPFLAGHAGHGPDLRLAQDCHELFLKRKRKARQQGETDSRAGSASLNTAGPSGSAPLNMPAAPDVPPHMMNAPPPPPGLAHPMAHVHTAPYPPPYPLQEHLPPHFVHEHGPPPPRYYPGHPPGPPGPPGHYAPPPDSFRHAHEFEHWQGGPPPSFAGGPSYGSAYPPGPPPRPGMMHMHAPPGPHQHNGDYYQHGPPPPSQPGFVRPPGPWRPY